jgi:hypothetical protein
MDLHSLWIQIASDLARARNTLPENAATHSAVKEYEDFLSHNELQLACEALEEYAKSEPVTMDFWLALRDAATNMQLPEHANRYWNSANIVKHQQE